MPETDLGISISLLLKKECKTGIKIELTLVSSGSGWSSLIKSVRCFELTYESYYDWLRAGVTIKVMCMAVDVLESLTTSRRGFHSLPTAAINSPCDWREEVMRDPVDYVAALTHIRAHTRFSVNNTDDPDGSLIILVCHNHLPTVNLSN